MGLKDFIIFVRGCEIKMQGLALARFNALEKLSKHISAGPGNKTELKQSFLRLKVKIIIS
jgi:hypothetical protein